MPFRRHHTAAALVAALVLAPSAGPQCWTPLALAAAPPEHEAQARALFQKAEVHFNLGEFQQALALYSEAYRLKPLPGFLFNIAQCHRFMGHYEDAAFSFRVYLDRAPQASNRAEVENLIAQMERQAPRPPTKVSPEAVPPPAGPGPPKNLSVGNADIVEPAPPASQAVSPWFWPTVGGGAALVAAGLVTGQMASNRSEAYGDDNATDAERRRLKASGEDLVIASIVCLSAGGVALAGAGALWLWGSPEPTTRVAAAPMAGGGVFVVSGAF